MAYDVEQLINLQNQIGNEPVMPDALDRYAAMQNITCLLYTSPSPRD